MSEEKSIREIRLEKLERLRELNHDPYKVERFDRSGSADELLAMVPDERPEDYRGPDVKFAGRVVSYRLMGKAGFAHISDGDGKIQAYFKKDELGEIGWEVYNLLDIGDHIGVEGYLFVTRTGEKSIHVTKLTPLSKSLQVLPLGKEKDGQRWYGLEDVEQRYRHRHLDLICNPEARDMLIKRSKIVTAVRRYFEREGFIEVETPLLQLEAGGAAARPFLTHYNAYDIDVKLRISLELYLKRLICGDLPKVFEIGRVFRNEGVSNRHNPEFTLLEWYEAYANLEDTMAHVEKLFQYVAKDVFGSPVIWIHGDPSVREFPFFTQQSDDSIQIGDESGFALFRRYRNDPEIDSLEPQLVGPGDFIVLPELGDMQVVSGQITNYSIQDRVLFCVESGSAILRLGRSEKEFVSGSWGLAMSSVPSAVSQGVLDFSKPWRRLDLLSAIQELSGIAPEELQDLETAKAAMERVGLPSGKENNLGGVIEKLLEHFVEPTLIEPTFIINYPIETSPLAKKHPENPRLTRRFEGYVRGREVCNAFSEINDPIDQRERFEQQLGERAKGDDEAHPMDEEFIYALETGMPPTGGCGIGMDRLAMTLTGADVLREIILFPTMKPERAETDEE